MTAGNGAPIPGGGGLLGASDAELPDNLRVALGVVRELAFAPEQETRNAVVRLLSSAPEPTALITRKAWFDLLRAELQEHWDSACLACDTREVGRS